MFINTSLNLKLYPSQFFFFFISIWILREIYFFNPAVAQRARLNGPRQQRSGNESRCVFPMISIFSVYFDTFRGIDLFIAGHLIGRKTYSWT